MRDAVMKIAVIGDIHSNHIALQAVLDSIDSAKVDGIVFMGDYVSDFPCPQKTMELLRECAARFVTRFIRGNREDYMIARHHGQSEHWRDGSQFGSLLYTYNNLTEADIRFFEAMPIAAMIVLDGCPPFAVCHASPENAHEWIYDNQARMRECADGLPSDLLLCGHTHQQKAVPLGAKTVIFTGSVGLAIGVANTAQFVMLEDTRDGWSACLMSVPYDRDAALAGFASPDYMEKAKWWAKAVQHTVRTGANATLHLLQAAFRLAREDGADTSLCIPEKHWQQAAAELGL